MGTRLTDTKASSNEAKHIRKRKKENFNMDFDYCAREDILLHGNGDIMICETILKDVNLNGISQPQESQLLYYDKAVTPKILEPQSISILTKITNKKRAVTKALMMKTTNPNPST